MKSAFTLPGLLAGTVFLVLASGCTTEPRTTASDTYRPDPPIGSHIVRRPPAPAPTEQEREKAGEKSGGQATGTSAQTKP